MTRIGEKAKCLLVASLQIAHSLIIVFLKCKYFSIIKYFIFKTLTLSNTCTLSLEVCGCVGTRL